MCTTDDEVCRLWNMFCKIKYIVFKIKKWTPSSSFYWYIVVGRASIWKNMLDSGNICLFFLKKANFLFPPTCLPYFLRQNWCKTNNLLIAGKDFLLIFFQNILILKNSLHAACNGCFGLLNKKSILDEIKSNFYTFFKG